MRASRLIYVGNDPALRGVMFGMLAVRPEIELVFSTGSAHEALSHAAAEIADVALLDVALGTDSMDGIALGCALRDRNPEIGLVLHSQHPLPQLPMRVPASQDWGWSTLHERAVLDMDLLVTVLRDTAAGLVHRDVELVEAPVDGPVAKLSPRQRQIMSLVAAGWDNRAIADRLDLSADALRQDMSREPGAAVGDERQQLRSKPGFPCPGGC